MQAEPGEQALSRATAEIPATIEVTLDGVTRELPYREGETILETARRAGLQAPFSCQAGNCATCMAHVDEGEVEMRVNDALYPDEVAEGWILTCQGVPRSATVRITYEL